MTDRRVLILLIAAYVAAAFVAWPHTYGTMLVAYAQQLLIFPVLLLIGVPAAAVIMRRHAPFDYIFSLAGRPLLRFGAVAIVFCCGIAAFTTYKMAIPDLVPFYADPLFADIDALLHRGNPGEFAHALIPEYAHYALGMLYGPVWFVQWFGLVAFVALSEDRALRRQYFWTMALVIAVLGTLMATAFSSVGPILYERFYGTDRFVALTDAIEKSTVGDYMATASGYLYEAYLGGLAQAGAGISAMPSMHLAITTTNALMLARLNRYAGAVACLYLATILLGSVFLGWHYAVDSYASIALTGLIWYAVQRVLSRKSALSGSVPLAPAGTPVRATS